MLEELKEKFPQGILEADEQENQTLLKVDVSHLLQLAQHLKTSGFVYPADITAVDDGKALLVIYRIYSVDRKHYHVIKVPTARKNGRVPSVAQIWRGAEWFEREIFDLFGVSFDNHPDLRRILLTEETEGHPLLKEQ